MYVCYALPLLDLGSGTRQTDEGHAATLWGRGYRHNKI